MYVSFTSLKSMKTKTYNCQSMKYYTFCLKYFKKWTIENLMIKRGLVLHNMLHGSTNIMRHWI